MTSGYFITARKSWKLWETRSFKKKLIISVVLVVFLLALLPFFFQYIEKRPGIVIQDTLMSWFKPADLSIPIFIIIWSSATMMVVQMIRDAESLLRFIDAYIIMTLLRLFLILIFPLEPPVGLIPLRDPLSNTFYGSTFITKDLFFSGHTATIFLIVLSVDIKWQKVYTSIVVFILALLLIIQHVHYTIDVIFAFPFAYLSYLVGKRMAGITKRI